MFETKFVATNALAMHVAAAKDQNATGALDLCHRAERAGRRHNRGSNDRIIRLVG